jgi:hypothetical protein
LNVRADDAMVRQPSIIAWLPFEVLYLDGLV